MSGSPGVLEDIIKLAKQNEPINHQITAQSIVELVGNREGEEVLREVMGGV